MPLINPYHAITSGSLLQADAYSWHYQPASLVGNERFAAGVFALRRFMLSGLTHSGLSGVLPLGRQALGLSVQHMGGLPSRQSEAAFGFAQRLGNQASVGVQFQYQMYQAVGYRQQANIGYTVAGRLRLSPQVQALAALTNPVALHGHEDQISPSRYELGVGADISSDLFLGCSLVQTGEGRPSVQVGLQYRLLHQVYGRLGVLTGSGQFVVGGGYRFGCFRLDVFSMAHPQLGLSPGIQLFYQPPAKE